MGCWSQLTSLLVGVLRALAQARVRPLAALPISADAGWIRRLCFRSLYAAVLFWYFPLAAVLVLTGTNSLLWRRAKETAATSNARFLLL